jgi:AhpD family alkylhydroperoxidase
MAIVLISKQYVDKIPANQVAVRDLPRTGETLLGVTTMALALKEIATIEAKGFGAGREAHAEAATNWPEMTAEYSRQLRNLRTGASDVMRAFSGIAQSALAPKALDGKTKELIALAVAVAARCDDCIAFHVKAVIEQGASRDEVTEALGMAIYMGAGPSVMYASHALEAHAQFTAQSAPPPANVYEFQGMGI